MLIAALLHDILEDSFILSPVDIELIFGPRVTHLVKILTKPHIEHKDKHSKFLRNIEYYHKIANTDKYGVIIKLADRLSNVRDLSACSTEKIKRQIEETDNIFMPLAEFYSPELHRLLTVALDDARKLI